MVASLVGPLVAVSCTSSPRTEPAVLAPPLDAPAPGEFPGLHQVVTFHPGVISGGVPGGEGFATLAAMGVKTIISVDGGAPDVAAAKAAGIRYIHLPMGYDGCEESRVLELTRATRDSMERGGVYIHCHHGKHRSPAAAAVQRRVRRVEPSPPPRSRRCCWPPRSPARSSPAWRSLRLRLATP